MLLQDLGPPCGQLHHQGRLPCSSSGQVCAQQPPIMLSCRVRVAEKLGFKICFHLSKKKTEKLVLTRNILNQLNKQKNVSSGGLNVSQWQLQSQHCMVLSERNSHCGHVDGITSQKDTSYSIFLSELCTKVSGFITSFLKMYFSYCFKCSGHSCVCMLSNRRILSFWESPHT